MDNLQPSLHLSCLVVQGGGFILIGISDGANLTAADGWRTGCSTQYLSASHNVIFKICVDVFTALSYLCREPMICVRVGVRCQSDCSSFLLLHGTWTAFLFAACKQNVELTTLSHLRLSLSFCQATPPKEHTRTHTLHLSACTHIHTHSHT